MVKGTKDGQIAKLATDLAKESCARKSKGKRVEIKIYKKRKRRS